MDSKKRMVIDYSETINLFTELDAYPMPNVLKMVEDISQYKYFSTFDLKELKKNYQELHIGKYHCQGYLSNILFVFR